MKLFGGLVMGKLNRTIALEVLNPFFEEAFFRGKAQGSLA